MFALGWIGDDVDDCPCQVCALTSHLLQHCRRGGYLLLIQLYDPDSYRTEEQGTITPATAIICYSFFKKRWAAFCGILVFTKHWTILHQGLHDRVN